MRNAQIHITLKPTLLDTQGATVLKALHQLGHENVRDVRIGKLIEVQLDDTLPPAQQQSQLETMCRQLLANPVIEDFSIVLSDAALSGANASVSATSSTRYATPLVPVVVPTDVPGANIAAVAQPMVSPTNPIQNVAPALLPISHSETLGSEPTTIGDPFAVSYETYAAMTADEKLDLQGRAWNLHGATVLNELDARRAAWIVQCGSRVYESGATLDSMPSDTFLIALGSQTDLVPFVFTRPPQ